MTQYQFQEIVLYSEIYSFKTDGFEMYSNLPEG